jgi:hypothetical protein
MNSDEIQALINLGIGLASPFLGRPTTWYRPECGDICPIDQRCQMGTLSVRFDTDPQFSSTKSPMPGKPQWYALYDRTLTQVGDYLVSDQGTFFVSSQVNLLPTQVVQCNRTVTISRQTEGKASFDPASAYGGDQSRTEELIIYRQYPASLLTKSRGERGDTNLPGDVKLGTYELLIPQLGDTTIRSADRVTDDLGQLYSVSSAEQSPLGWRCLVVATET